LWLATIVIATLLLFSGCGSDEQKLFTLMDPADTGIDFINKNTETETTNIFTYEYMYNGGGVAVGDINNDGLADIYFSSNQEENRLYLNRGNLEFEDITEKSGTGCGRGWKTGVSMADVNGDGWLDIYICRSSSDDPEKRRNVLLINKGNLIFQDEAKAFGLDDDSYSTQAAFFDYDRDGDLDAFLLNHSLLKISNSYNISLRNTDVRYPYVGNKLLRNDNGAFHDVSDSVGVFGPASNYGLGVSLSDINNDGWIDIYTGCDYTGRDKLLLNDHGRSFNDATDSLLSHISKFTMGTDIADFNGDGLMDIYTLDMLPEDNRRQKQLMGSDRYDVYATMRKSGLHSQYMRNMLHLNNGNGTFSEIGQLAGVSNTDWSWAPLFADFDNDGIQDLFVSNGFKRDLTDNDFTKFKAFQEIVTARRQRKQVSFLEVMSRFKENRIPNYIFRGNGDLTFSNNTIAWGLDRPSLTNGVAYSDLDNDGDLDLIMNNVNATAGIYRNNAQDFGNHFLTIQLVGDKENVFAVGASVTVYCGEKKIVQELLPVRGFQSSVDPMLHFGIGSADKIDSVTVRWPSGEKQSVSAVVTGARLLIRHPENLKPDIKQRDDPDKAFFTAMDDAIPYKHNENDFIDFRTQPLLPRMYSTQGPALAVGDVDGDGRVDVFAGGAKGQAAELFVQTTLGKYSVKTQKAFIDDRLSEDIDAEFFDADNDGDLDLFVASGGYEFLNSDKSLQDRLYKNDGKGNFSRVQLPEYLSSSACVKPADVDNDGDMDVFVGSRLTPGRYPEPPESFLLLNNGKGKFTIGVMPDELTYAGMITDACWTDLNGDRQPDLIVVGEWMPIRVFINQHGKFSEESSAYIKVRTEGFWNTILAEDFDGDGDQDFVIGNLGLNTQMKISESRPATMVYDDFDKNGSVDPIISYFVGAKSYPYASRDELTEQLPSLKKHFVDYSSYADATIGNVLSREELSRAEKLTAYLSESCYVRNDGNHFTVLPMPMQFQFAPVFAMAAVDVNSDGIPDLVSGGNLSAARARTGKLSGNTGFIFLNDGRANFTFVPPAIAGISIPGDVRQIAVTNNTMIVGVNDSKLTIYRLNNSEHVFSSKPVSR
jgi:enediyne biosynthesis protein E4